MRGRRHQREFLAAVVVSVVLGSPLAAQGDLPAAGQQLQNGLRAAAAGDTEKYFVDAAAAARLVPPHAVLYYHLARAAALSGRADSALRVLHRLESLGTPRDPATDSAFVTLWPRADFRDRVAALTRAALPRVASDTAFVIDLPNLVAENIAFDPVARVFYVGSMARRTVLRVDSSGRATNLLVDTAGMGQPLGMRVDAATRTLWVAVIWPADSAAGFPLQRSALLNVDLATGRVRARHVPGNAARPHLLNDIAIARDGSLYITDSDASAIWQLRSGSDELEMWLELGSRVVYPNGIALSPDERTLFVAHQTGILAIERATRRMEPIAQPDNANLMGIDGLYATATGLAAIQNTVPVHQVIRIQLDYAASTPRVVCVAALERRHPSYVMPTTGTMVADHLFYVANAELRRLDARGALLNPADERRTVILRLPLAAPGAGCP